MKMYATSVADAYKQCAPMFHNRFADSMFIDILSSYSNFTPRKNAYMKFSDQSDGKIVIYGTSATFREIVELWSITFFSVSRTKAIRRLERQVTAMYGTTDNHQPLINNLKKLHRLGYLPLEVRAIDEGTRYPIGLPVFTSKSTVPEFGWLVNYLETISSNLIWPMINTATKIEQFYLQARHYGELSAPKEIVDQWLPICVHEFGLRGYMGPEAGIRLSSCHNIFFKGTDTPAVLDYFEDYLDTPMDSGIIAVSVTATEHADVSRLLSEYRYRGIIDDTELEVLRDLLSGSKGIISYVSDTEDYYRVIRVYAAILKEIILNREDREDGQPAITVFRPDSSRRTPLTVICGYKQIVEFRSDILQNTEETLGWGECVKVDGKYYIQEKDRSYTEIPEDEALGSLNALWDTFGGEILETQSGPMKFINPKVGLIYGEAISQTHQKEIYERMIEMGFSATNILMGKGSYATMENNTRDLFSMSYKQTFSKARFCKYSGVVYGDPTTLEAVQAGKCFWTDEPVCPVGSDIPTQYAAVDLEGSTVLPDGTFSHIEWVALTEEEALGKVVDLAQQKKPMGDVSKTSARGLLAVRKVDGEFTLFQDQTEEQEQSGELKLLLRNGVFYKNQDLWNILDTYNS